MNKIIAAVNGEEALEAALASKTDTIFCLTPNIKTLEEWIKAVHLRNKKIYIHMDMAEGIGKDKFGIEFVRTLGIDGIISTRANIIKYAKAVDLITVQRFFAIDAQSIKTIIETTSGTKPNMIEIMPGIAAKAIDKVKKALSIPIIAGGLIETEEEVATVINSGAYAVSTSNVKLWELQL